MLLVLALTCNINHVFSVCLSILVDFFYGNFIINVKVSQPLSASWLPIDAIGIEYLYLYKLTWESFVRWSLVHRHNVLAKITTSKNVG